LIFGGAIAASDSLQKRIQELLSQSLSDVGKAEVG